MVTLDDIRAAAVRIRGVALRTPLLDVGPLSLKCENLQPMGAFKVRGGLNLIASLTPDERGRGVVTASTGNHGQSIALACARHGVACTVFVPRGNNPEKNAAMRGLGAELIEDGRDYDESLEIATRLVAERGLHMVHSTNDPMVVAGAATITLEILEQVEAGGHTLDAMVVAGCETSVSGPPRDRAMRARRKPSVKATAASAPPATSKAMVAPPDAIWRLARSCWGCDGRNG